MSGTYIPVRISGTQASGVHVWEIGAFRSLTAAKNARNDTITKAAEHLTHHSGPGGYVGIAPIWPGGLVVVLHTASGAVEVEHIYTIYSRAA
jgi:hypothetical protein